MADRVQTSEINKQCRYNDSSAKELISPILIKVTKSSESSLYLNCQKR